MPIAAAVALAVWAGTVAGGERAGPGDELLAESLPLRTALHRDPSLAAPFQQLLELYRKANRTGELVEVYRAHLARYPGDANAQIVLIRLLVALGDPEAGAAARGAILRFPDHPYLHFLRYQVLRARHEPGALDELDQAIERETVPARKRAWLDELLPLAIAEDRRPLAEKHLKALAAPAAQTPDGALDLARKMLHYGLHQLALDTLEAAAEADPTPETRVAIQAAAADAEVALNRPEAAAARLDRLLAQLTADYWRRPEIVRRRIALVASDQERQAMIQSARERVAARPADDTAVLDLAQLLTGFELRREALEGLRQASRRIPGSQAIEQLTLELLDLLRDEHGREAYLAERVKAFPERKDLAFRHVRSLFLLGRRKEAMAELEQLVGTMEPDARVAHLLEIARFLRRASLTSEAARVFEQVVQSAPARLDVRRELAETWLALGERSRARELFARPPQGDVAMERLLDVIPFLIEQRMFREAKGALTARMQEAPTNVDLRLLLISLEGRTGNQRSGGKLVLDTRAIADTVPRYRRWLEAAVAFHQHFDAAEAFLDEEEKRLDQDAQDWSSARLARRLALADVAVQNECAKHAAAMLERDLAANPPPEARVQLRRQLITVLQASHLKDAPIEDHLKKLAAEAPQATHECNARLAVLYDATGRHHLIGPLLEKLDLAVLTDPALLSRLEKLYAQHNRGDKVLEILRRLTDLDPSNRGYWERWLAALALTGDEPRLRGAIRGLLVGIDRMPLSDETKAVLQAHLIDSQWRSIAQLAADGQPAALADALARLATVERAAHHRSEWLWVAWTRAHLLHRLGRTKARDEAIRELDRVVKEAIAPGKPEHEQPQAEAGETAQALVMEGITFPDGLTLSLEQAKRLLSRPVEGKPPARPLDRQGPVPELAVRWAFDTEDVSPVVGIVPLGPKRIAVVDLPGTVYCLDAATGKLLWQREPQAAASATPVRPASPPRYPRPSYISSLRYTGPVPSYHSLGQYLPPRPVADGQGRLYVPSVGHLACLSARDGRLLWTAQLGPFTSGVAAAQGAVPASVCVGHSRVLAFDPVSGTAGAFAPETGKLLWERVLASDKAVPVTWSMAGASLSGRRFLVYGACAAILDAATGKVEWSFDASHVRSLPIALEEPDQAAAAPGRVSAAGPRAYTISYMQGGRRAWVAQPPAHSGASPAAIPMPPTYVSHLHRDAASASQQAMAASTVLAAPAVVWAESHYPRLGLLHGEHLLLLGHPPGPPGPLAVRLDLPLAARQLPAAGVFVGFAGQMACFLQQGQFVTVDIDTGESQPFNLAEVNGGQANARVQAAIDGSLVYLTGPGGITCLNARTSQRVFHAPWPERIAPKDPPAPPQSVQYFWQGISVYRENHYGPCLPPVDCVHAGMLLATVTPSRVVALVERVADGR